MYGCLRRNFNFSKLLIFNRGHCLRYISAISVLNHKESRSNSNQFYLQVHQPKLLQVRHSSFSVQSFLKSVDSIEACGLVKQILIDAHDFSGLPWFVTIIGSAVFMKLFIYAPCAIFQQYFTAKIVLTQIELARKIKSKKEEILVKAKREKWTEDEFLHRLNREVKEEWKALLVKNNCHPFKIIILYFIQFSFWFLLAVAIRSLVTDIYKETPENLVAAPQLTLGGPFWCQNLTVPDPLYILPTICSLAFLANTEISALYGNTIKFSSNKLKSLIVKYITVFLRFFALGVFFISAASPSGLTLFWASTSVITVALSLSLKFRRIRRYFRIPETPFDSVRPFSRIWTKFITRLETISSKMK